MTNTAATDADARIRDTVQPFIDRGEVAGAVLLVAAPSGVLSLQALGWADIAAKRPMRTDTIFWIASQTKPMTATAVMMLVDEGRLDLDTPVTEYLPEFRGQRVIVEEDDDHTLLKPSAQPITLRHLLSHTSGLPFRSPMETPSLDLLPLRDAVLGYAALPLLFEPGTRCLYSNEGINTAARILEVVSGTEYSAFLRERLLYPLDMTDTTFLPDDAQVARTATTYRPSESDSAALEPFPTHFLHYPLTGSGRYPMPAGGLFSTAGDVARFCRMILNGGALDGRRYISEEALRQMTIRQTPEDFPENRGLGWGVTESGRVFGHGGALSTNMTIDRERGLATAYFVQHSGFSGEGGKCAEAFHTAAMAAFSV